MGMSVLLQTDFKEFEPVSLHPNVSIGNVTFGSIIVAHSNLLENKTGSSVKKGEDREDLSYPAALTKVKRINLISP